MSLEITLARGPDGQLTARPFPGREEGKTYSGAGLDQDGNALLVEWTDDELAVRAQDDAAHAERVKVETGKPLSLEARVAALETAVAAMERAR